jgi:hypothetical protein
VASSAGETRGGQRLSSLFLLNVGEEADIAPPAFPVPICAQSTASTQPQTQILQAVMTISGASLLSTGFAAQGSVVVQYGDQKAEIAAKKRKEAIKPN